MKNKKLKLNALKVQSFVTAMEDESSKIKGGTGGTGVDTCGAIPTTTNVTQIARCSNFGTCNVGMCSIVCA